jgi:hypothetical protein
MDERFDHDLRLDLTGLLAAAQGAYPEWATSPVAQRAAASTTAATRLRSHWLLVAAATIAVLCIGAATLLAGGVRLPDPPPPPWLGPDQPTDHSDQRSTTDRDVVELDDVQAAHSRILSLVRDADGRHVWVLLGPGANDEPDNRTLLRLDPRTSTTTSWQLDATHADSASPIAPARGGGVWLIGPDGTTLRRFHTAGQGVTVPAPSACAQLSDSSDPPQRPSILDVAETVDGHLWLATGCGVFRQVGHTWHPAGTEGLPPAPRSEMLGATRIGIAADGSVWAAFVSIDQTCGRDLPTIRCGWTSPLGLGRFDGSRWTLFDGHDADPLAQPVQAIEAGPDGSVWVSTGLSHEIVDDNTERFAVGVGGVARFDGHGWDAWDQMELELAAPLDVSIGSDGSVLVLGTTNDLAAGSWIGAASVVRLDGSKWAPLAGGLPDEPLGGPLEPIATIVALDQDLAYAATQGGLYRLTVDHWELDRALAAQVGAN